MSDRLESKITNLSVVKLRNRTTITCVARLDLDNFANLYFRGLLDSPRLVQGLPNSVLRATGGLRRFLLLGCLLAGYHSPALAEIVSLTALGANISIDRSQISVSGISSGAFMAHQFHVIHSSNTIGAGLIAGGPYRCANGSYAPYSWFDFTGLYSATFRCSSTNLYGVFQGPPDVDFSIGETRAEAAKGNIDDPENMYTDKVWLFSGGKDEVVPSAVMQALHRYYRVFLHPDNIAYIEHEDANHAMITDDFGAACDLYGSPYLNNCGIDAAKELLQKIYGRLNPVAGPADLQGVIEFDQTEFFDSADPSISMARRGYLYVPESCRKQASCRLHVAFHGCQQNQALVGNNYYRDAGYNEWAETNHIIVMYPQTKAWTGSVFSGLWNNPKACWDWWGYSGEHYHRKHGKQIRAVATMVNALSGEPLLDTVPP